MFKHTTSFAPELSIVITCTSLSIFIQTNITSEIHHKCNINSVKQVKQNAGDSIKFYAELNPKSWSPQPNEWDFVEAAKGKTLYRLSLLPSSVVYSLV